MTDESRCGYPSEQVKALTDQQATVDNIRDGLRWLVTSTQPGDTAIFFFSGHGGQIASGPSTGNFLLPFDAAPDNFDETAIEGRELSNLLSAIKSDRLLVIIDACHAGGLGEIKAIPDQLYDFKSGFDTSYYDQLATGKGRIIIASSQSGERSWITDGMRNSLFTHYVLEALRGQAQTYQDGFIGILDLFNFVSDKVTEHLDSKQNPLLKGQVNQNFPIALYLGGQKKDAPTLNVENPRGLLLFSDMARVLQGLFDQHQCAIIEREFGAGFSGGRVLFGASDSA